VRDRNKKIFVIAAHPDDEVLGLGGTIAWFSKIRNDEVYVLFVTEGCSSQYKNNKAVIKKKKREAEKANKILGTKEIFFADLPDMRLDSLLHVQLNEVIEKGIRDIAPDIVFTHFPDINKDHVLIFESTMVAVRPVPGFCVRSVLAYAPSSSTEWSAPLPGNLFAPNMYVDISQTLDLKLKAFKCYETEMREYPHPRSIKAISLYAEKIGVTVGLTAAESFMVIRDIAR